MAGMVDKLLFAFNKLCKPERANYDNEKIKKKHLPLLPVMTGANFNAQL